MTCQKHEGRRRSREWSQESWEPGEVGQRHFKFMIVSWRGKGPWLPLWGLRQGVQVTLVRKSFATSGLSGEKQRLQKEEPGRAVECEAGPGLRRSL